MKSRHYLLAVAMVVLCSNASATTISTEETFDERTSLNDLAPDDVLEIVEGGHLILNERADHNGPLRVLLNGGDLTSAVDYKHPDNNTGEPAFIGIYDGVFTAFEFESFGFDRDATVEIGINGTMIVETGYLADFSDQGGGELRRNLAALIDTGALFPSEGLTLNVEDLGGGEVKVTAVPEPANIIRAFSASESSAPEGANVVLSWVIKPGATATIEPEVGDVTGDTDAEGNGSKEVTMTSTTTFKLTATADGETDEREVTVEVPLINDFAVDMDSVPLNSTVTLSWNAKTTAALSIEPGIGSVDADTTDGKGTKTVQVTESTTFVLKAVEGEAMETKDVRVGVIFPNEQIYPDPEEGWSYVYGGDVIPDEDEWDHDNGSDQWDSEPMIKDNDFEGGTEIVSTGGANFLRIQDAKTSGGNGDNRKIMFTRGVLQEEIGNGDVPPDPLDEATADGGGMTFHFKFRLASGEPIDEGPDGDWPEEGEGTSLNFGGKGFLGIDAGIGTFGFALSTGEGDEEWGFDEPGLQVNGIFNVDDPDNFLPIADSLTDWHEFWVTLELDEEAEEGTHKLRIWHNGAAEPVEFEVGTAESGDVGGTPEPSLYMGHPATDQIGAFDVDFLHVAAGVIEPGAGSSGPRFEITNVSCNAAERSCTVTWNSKPGATYTIEISRSAENFTWLELADGLNSGGTSTSFTEQNIPEGETFRYYRVKEE